MSFNKFEEYKLFVEDTARFSERRQSVNNSYVTINSIILTALAFLVKDAGFDRPWQAFAVIPVSFAGAIICWRWMMVINNYKKLVDFRINQLRIIESDPDMAGCHRMYHAEDEIYPRNAGGKTITHKALSFSEKEKFLPYLFTTIYVATGVSLFGFLLGKIFS
ncbi:MAG: RipA family octameric membrane protein [Blastocatellia bacterium]